jgi:peptide-methionine (S)-S-oxide reductase
MSAFPRTRFRRSLLQLAAIGALTGGGIYVRAALAEAVHVIPPPAVTSPPSTAKTETAIFAGGCFWGVQGVFQHVKGVTNAVSGYAGGSKNTAVYEVVSSGATGHAEAVKITFDPAKTSYGKLLQIYFSVAHDPTELNRQGPDDGTQYRSAIFPTTPEQAKIAAAYVAQLDKTRVFGTKIATRIEAGQAFYAAENHHQNFLTLNPAYPYIVINDLPKVRSLKKLFPTDYREAPVLVALASNGR